MTLSRAAAAFAALAALSLPTYAVQASPERPSSESPAAASIPIPAPRPRPAQIAGLLQYEDRLSLARTVLAARTGRWKEAERTGRQIENPLARRIAQWIWLTGPASSASWSELRDFIDSSPGWPLLDRLRAQMERRMPTDLEPQAVIGLLAPSHPSTGAGLLRLAEALDAWGRTDEANQLALDAWRGEAMSRADERRLLRQFGGQLTRDDHLARLDSLIWARNWSSARSQLRRVDSDDRRIGEARILLGTRSAGVDYAISKIPEAARGHPGLVYERIRWRRRSGLHDGVRELLSVLPPDLGKRPSLWWWESKVQIRRLLAEGKPADAYFLAARHERFEGVARAEAAWLAGWLALEFLDRDTDALAHFRAMRDSVSQPISVARAEYWSARAARALGLHDQAETHLTAAAAYPETYYGQAARRELGLAASLPQAVVAPPEILDLLRELELGMGLRMLAEAGGEEFARPFVLQLADDAKSVGDIATLHALCLDLGMHRHAIEAAKRGIRSGYRAPRLLFPVPPGSILPRMEDSRVPLPVVLAVANQESAFDRAAVSHAGARGLMQLMPATARRYARQIGVSYIPADLTEDPFYNVLLGQAVLADLLERFDGALPLVLAAYNAGETRVRKWLRDYGDPRAGEVSMTNWVELIPVAETRNYVQRVMEGKAVYEALLSDAPPAAGPDAAVDGSANREPTTVPPQADGPGEPPPQARQSSHYSETILRPDTLNPY